MRLQHGVYSNGPYLLLTPGRRALAIQSVTRENSRLEQPIALVAHSIHVPCGRDSGDGTDRLAFGRS